VLTTAPDAQLDPPHDAAGRGPRRASRLLAYAAGTVASAAVLYGLVALFGDQAHQFLFAPILVIAATALAFGVGPALAASAAAIAGGSVLLFAPVGALHPDRPFDVLRVSGAALVCVVVALGAGSLRDAYRRARRERAAALRATERLRRQKEATERAVVLRDEVLAVVSHDLKSPLATIAATADVLRRKHVKALPELERHVSNIRQNVDAMNRLILDLLDVASIEAGRLSVEPRDEDAVELAREALARIRPVAEAAGVETSLRSSAAVARCDGPRVLQVLSNLLSNAVKATPRGGRVELVVEADGTGTRFAVVDTGCGIDADELPHVFDRFRRGRSAPWAGSGLGLAIARGIAEAHGGTLSARSRVGEGSRFELALPARG
jgi:signal transduction histidine kinase